MSVIAVLQARFSSTRLPGKVLKPILGVPMLVHQIERIKSSKMLAEVIVATSADATDDLLAQTIAARGETVFRGSLDNVLERFYGAVKSSTHRPQHVVRLTGDCPLVDPAIIDEIVSHHLISGSDYTSNSVQPTYPDGLDVEVMTLSALEKAMREAHLPSHFEHVTPYIHQNPEIFKVTHHRRDGADLSDLRWTVDEPADFELVRRIFERLYPTNKAFSTNDVLAFLDANPELLELNKSFVRNEGLLKSYKEDEKVKGGHRV
jgi:spore coat polysaccharide biosynthesis protein SpsF